MTEAEGARGWRRPRGTAPPPAPRGSIPAAPTCDGSAAGAPLPAPQHRPGRRARPALQREPGPRSPPADPRAPRRARPAAPPPRARPPAPRRPPNQEVTRRRKCLSGRRCPRPAAAALSRRARREKGDPAAGAARGVSARGPFRRRTVTAGPRGTLGHVVRRRAAAGLQLPGCPWRGSVGGGCGGERGGAAASEARRCQRLLRERGFGCLNTCARGAAGDGEAAARSALLEPSPTRRDLPAQGILGLVVPERMEADTWRTRRGGSAPGGPAGLGTAPGPEVDGGGQGESRAGGCGEATRDPPSPRARSLRAVGDPLAEEKRSQRCLLRDSGRLKGSPP
uniref:translation initiation factor IF-2-like n=1 Tax=Nyctereutes procyonoides TaxID=34880 RepID=UPI0024442780|nr:translation initiation factor IF-2-like [Nyctereutes procyonoides]